MRPGGNDHGMAVPGHEGRAGGDDKASWHASEGKHEECAGKKRIGVSDIRVEMSGFWIEEGLCTKFVQSSFFNRFFSLRAAL